MSDKDDRYTMQWGSNPQKNYIIVDEHGMVVWESDSRGDTEREVKRLNEEGSR